MPRLPADPYDRARAWRLGRVGGAAQGADGCAGAWRSDVVAVAKRGLRAGEVLDGEGGFCVWGRQCPAERSQKDGLLPLGLAHNVRLTRDVAEGTRLAFADVALDPDGPAVRARREIEAAFGRRTAP